MKDVFEQTQINGMSLANRFVRSATWDGMATDEGECTPRLTDLMTKLAKGGVGLIITGHAFVHEKGKHQPWQLGIHKDELIPGLQAMTNAVHEKGSRIVVQLGYGGAYLSKRRVREMTDQDIRETVHAFGRAALRAKEAGFDGVQLFSAHGFLLSQFLCPRYNERTDGYGGNITNRARILMEVLQSIRNGVGRRYPVLAKLNGRDFIEKGLILEESIKVGIMLQEGGIDAIELSGGLLNNPNLMREKVRSEEDEAYFKEEARAFKKEVCVPLILVGGIRSYSVAQQLVRDGIADYISMCRPFIREPDLINRWKKGDLRKAICISCNNCVEQAKKGEGISCIPIEEEIATENFFPQSTKEIPAGLPHPPGTCYRISVGLEQLESQFIPAIRIQVVHNGEVSEKRPSFSLFRGDLERVSRAIRDLLEEQAANSEGG